MSERHKVFVTGGTGFVGSHLVEELLQSGDEVTCLVRNDHKWLGGLDVRIVQGELSDKDLLRENLVDVDYVYHVAALTRGDSWSDFQRANIDGTTALVEAAAVTNSKIKKVLLTSSLAVVGDSTKEIATESSSLSPISKYGRSKVEMETKASQLCEELGVPYVIVRPPSVYGPRERDIFTFFKTAQRGVGPFIGSGDEPEISLVYVKDLVRGMIASAESTATAGKIYFLGGREAHSWKEVISATEAALGRRVRPLAIPQGLVQPIGGISELVGRFTEAYPPLNREKAKEILRACKMCSSDRAAKDFDYNPPTDILSGIRSTIAWYRQEGWL